MEVSTDPYELKLFQMFKSCETKKCNSGLLDEDALRHLCTILELRENDKLISSLAKDGGLKLGVSFEKFKEALLNFLGTEYDTTSAAATLTSVRERSLVIRDDVDTSAYIESPPESSDREVSPKLVVGTKKYGRRSRPHTAMDVFSVTDSDNSDEEEQAQHSLNGKVESSCSKNSSSHVQRSASQTDIHGNRRLRTPHMSGVNKLKRCSSLPARKNMQQLQSKLNASKNNKQPTAIPTQNAATATLEHSSSVESLGSHQHQHQHQYQQTHQQRQHQQELIVAATAFSPYSIYEQHCNSSSYNISNFGTSYCKDIATAPEQLENVNVECIIDIWEQANVLNGRTMLVALGFDEEHINVPQLIKVLEDELRNDVDLQDESHASMLHALVAIQSAELCTLRQVYRQLHAENMKLRSDNKEANRRVTLLAVEIDERHASLEDNSKKQLQALEQKHANVMRELTVRMANDRDNWTALTSRLETQIKQLEQEENKLKAELDAVRHENSELENEQQRTQKQITELLEKNIKLNNELADKKPMEKCAHSDDSLLDKSTTEDDEVLQLIEKISSLQMENAQLRDKNDELVVEVENLHLELSRNKSSATNTTLGNSTKSSSVSSSRKSPHANEDANSSDDAAGGNGATATKRRGDSPSKTRITEESPRLGKLRKCTDESAGGSEHSDTSGDWMPLNSELQRSEHATESHADSSTDLAVLRQTIQELEEKLAKQQSIGMTTTDERCKELEVSLEQMQRAYEDCEDYWQSKLSEERQLFEKERQIYEDEQHESDKKFTELMEKVREYEEQFSKDGRLSPIEERDILEQQYAELEAEAADIRENSIIMLEEKSKEIETLQNEIEDLRMRLGESVEILTGACELNTEAVVQQLNADTVLSPASSPISYLWHQSTIQEPAKTFKSDDDVSATAMQTFGEREGGAVQAMIAINSPSKKANRNNLTTSETTIFSTIPFDSTASTLPPTPSAAATTTTTTSTVAPIQKPMRAKSPQQNSEGEIADCETSSTASNKSFDTQSIVSTRSNTQMTTKTERSASASSMKEELKRLKCFEISLKDQIKDLSLQRDGLVMELQQLHEARPVLEKAYARTAHPSLIQRVNQLELKNRHLQNVIKQQQQYTESLMQQSWQQHRIELDDLHTRIETQGAMLAEQNQRLQNADVLVKDLYVENAHLTATVQRLEQQRARVNLLHQQQHQQLQQQQQQQQQQRLIGGLPGMP